MSGHKTSNINIFSKQNIFFNISFKNLFSRKKRNNEEAFSISLFTEKTSTGTR